MGYFICGLISVGITVNTVINEIDELLFGIQIGLCIASVIIYISKSK